MIFIFSIGNHFFKRGSAWRDLDHVKQRSYLLSIDIEDEEGCPIYDTVKEYRIAKPISFKSIKIVTGKTEANSHLYEELLNMVYTDSCCTRKTFYKEFLLPSGLYYANLWIDEDGLEMGEFKRMCEYRHKWNDGWICEKCGIRKADMVGMMSDDLNNIGRII